MNIKEIAYQIASVNMKNKCSPAELEDFAEALVAELAKKNPPVYAFRRKGLDDFCTCDEHRYNELAQKHTLFEVKVLYHSPPTAEQIEQETAEAIAAYFEQQPHVEHFGDNIAEAVRSGKWREYL